MRQAKAAEAKHQQELKAAQDAQAARATKDAQAAKAAKADDERIAKTRDDNLKRMLAQAGNASSSTADGKAARDMAPSADLAGRIRAKVKANIIDTSAIQGNPVAEVEVQCSPDGTITNRRIAKSSGNPAWDETVLRALDKTRSLPREADGRIPAAMILVFSARE